VCSEALPGALPKGQNNPQRCPYGLYAEQLSGTAFTAPRDKNQRSWLYRTRPSVQHVPFEALAGTAGGNAALVSDFTAASPDAIVHPDQMRWLPCAVPGAGDAPVDWVAGLRTVGGAGEPTLKSGLAVHMYACNATMADKCLVNADGDFLIVPQQGALRVTTEFGVLDVAPKEICVVQRGMRFSVAVAGPSRGYVLEVFDRHFQLPDLGPIGANGLANARDFEQPVACYEDREGVAFTCVYKFGGQLFQARQAFSPFNVVAYHGNYVPYKYDLRKFCCMNSVTFDHPDPSIYTVLTCPGHEPGVAVADFVIFPPRWMAQEHSFRPPYYHRNCMSEFMGMVYGVYDAKTDVAGGGAGGKRPSGFFPGGASLHSCMVPHGPDAGTFAKATAASLKPHFFGGGLAFMFETSAILKLTRFARDGDHVDRDYHKCWANLPNNFDPTNRGCDDGADLVAWRAAAAAAANGGAGK
jgi:homogentisate 1,2-dioxygenase